MPFEIGAPVHDPDRKCYEVGIENAPVFIVTTGDISKIVFEGEVQEKLVLFVDEFLNKASPHFSKPLEKTLFFQRVLHTYSTDDWEDLSPGGKIVSWIPAHVLFDPSRYELHWRIRSIEKVPLPPGTEIVEADIDIIPPDTRPPKQPPQERIRQKIRQARLRVALARVHLEQITEKYYARYGNFDGLSDAESELSSDSEFNPNEPPRKI